MSSAKLSVGEVASLCGVSPDTIRHYERKGLLTPVERASNGYRVYPPEAVRRIRIVRRALAIGFSLDELSKIFRQRNAGTAPCRGVRELASRKLSELDVKIEEMLRLRSSLRATLEEWDEQLESVEGGQLAHLLDALGD
jgi:DNA-binding transcriptional MerR regulator